MHGIGFVDGDSFVHGEGAVDGDCLLLLLLDRVEKYFLLFSGVVERDGVVHVEGVVDGKGVVDGDAVVSGNQGFDSAATMAMP